jgi:hypothetical protein
LLVANDVPGKSYREIGLNSAAEPTTGAVRLVLIGRQEGMMLFTIAVILLVLWLLGLVSGYTLGNFIYVLLVIALVLFVLGLVSGRRRV